MLLTHSAVYRALKLLEFVLDVLSIMAKRVAPKKMVMKKIAKSTPLKKGTTPLEKGKVQQPSSGSKDKLQLTKKTLAKGSKVAMSLQEKVTRHWTLMMMS